MVEESELVRLSQERDRDAYSQLVAMHHQFIYGVVLSILRDSSEAQDVCQNIYMMAWRKIGLFHNKGPYRAWLSRMSKNYTLNYIRDSKGRAVKNPVYIDTYDDKNILANHHPSASPEELIIAEELGGLVRTCLEGMQEKKREAFQLIVLELKTYKEASEITGSPNGTLGGRVKDAKAILKKYIITNGGTSFDHYFDN